MKAVICDDIKAEREILEGMLCDFCQANSIEFLSIQFDSAEDMLAAYSEISDADVIFLDIFMAEISGMVAAKSLYDKGFLGSIVFCTTSTDFALESYKVNADGYLVKPYSINDFNHVMQRIKHRWNNSKRTISFLSNRLNLTVFVPDILFIETNKRGCALHTANNIFETTKTITDFTEELEKEKCFFRIGKSYLVNFHNLKNYDDDFIYMNNGEKIPMPVRAKHETKILITQWRWAQMEGKR